MQTWCWALLAFLLRAKSTVAAGWEDYDPVSRLAGFNLYCLLLHSHRDSFLCLAGASQALLVRIEAQYWA